MTRSVKEFDSFINETNLRDPNISNIDFTWSNGRSHSRLDRFFYTTGWEDMFQTVKQEALARIESDHFPLVLDINPFKWRTSPFRFENMRFAHKEFLGNAKKVVGQVSNPRVGGFQIYEEIGTIKTKGEKME